MLIMVAVDPLNDMAAEVNDRQDGADTGESQDRTK